MFRLILFQMAFFCFGYLQPIAALVNGKVTIG